MRRRTSREHRKVRPFLHTEGCATRLTCIISAVNWSTSGSSGYPGRSAQGRSTPALGLWPRLVHSRFAWEGILDETRFEATRELFSCDQSLSAGCRQRVKLASLPSMKLQPSMFLAALHFFESPLCSVTKTRCAVPAPPPHSRLNASA